MYYGYRPFTTAYNAISYYGIVQADEIVRDSVNTESLDGGDPDTEKRLITYYGNTQREILQPSGYYGKSLYTLDFSSANLAPTVTQNLTLTDSSSAIKLVQKTVSQNISISQNVTGFVVHNLIQNLTITQNVTAFKIVNVSLSQNISLTQLARPEAEQVVQNLTISGSAFANIVRPRSVNNTLSLSQAAVFNIDRPVTLTQNLTFNSTATASKIARGSISQNLSFSQSAIYQIIKTLRQNISLSQNISFSMVRIRNITQSLNIEQSLATFGNFTRSLFDSLTLTQTATSDEKASVFNNLTLTQSTTGSKGTPQCLTLTDSVSAYVSKGLSQNLSLTQNITYTITKTVSIVQNLTLTHSAYAYVNTPNLCSTPTGFEHRNTIVLSYPYSSPTTNLTLPSPIFDNSERRHYSQIVRESRGGTLHYFRDSNWGKYKRLNFTLNRLRCGQSYTELLDFLKLSIGKEIKLVDHENRTWRGVIVTPEASIVQDSRSGYSITLEFEGEPQ